MPDSVQITRVYDPTELTAAEASVVLRIASILREDYLIPDVDVIVVEMSHGVTVLPQKVGDQLRVQIARSSALLVPVIEFREKAFEVFGQFMKDFVRVRHRPPNSAIRSVVYQGRRRCASKDPAAQSLTVPL